jgi:hypothetical protein
VEVIEHISLSTRVGERGPLGDHRPQLLGQRRHLPRLRRIKRSRQPGFEISEHAGTVGHRRFPWSEAIFD